MNTQRSSTATPRTRSLRVLALVAGTGLALGTLRPAPLLAEEEDYSAAGFSKQRIE